MSFFEKAPFFILVVCLSLLNNLLIPLAIYFKKFGRRGYQGRGGGNAWGVLMDGVLAGAINLVAMNFLLEIRPAFRSLDLLLSLAAGFFVMVLMHAWLVWRRIEVWIMPRPGRWNEGGYWHMVSTSLQMGFLAFVLLLIIRHPSLLNLTLTQLTLLWGVLLGLLFLLCYSLASRGLKIGRLCLDNRSW